MPHYFILDAPVASPAKCGLCGYAGSDRKYLDPRLDYEFYGSLIFCESCIGTMANDFGHLSPSQAQSLEDRVLEAEKENVTLRSALMKMENAYDALGSLRSIFDGPVPSRVARNAKPEPKALPRLTVGADSISAADERLRDSETDKPAGKQGPTNISDSAKSDDLIAGL